MKMKAKLILAALLLLFHTRTSISQTAPEPEPTQPDQIQPVNTHPGQRPRVIVFVHGLHGDRNSWRAANNAYWPDMVRTDPRFAYSDVDVAEYPTPSSHGKMSSVQLA